MEIEKCTTLDEARNKIDSVDREIVELIAKRNDYIKQIAHFKTSVEEVISKMIRIIAQKTKLAHTP